MEDRTPGEAVKGSVGKVTTAANATSRKLETTTLAHLCATISILG